MKASTSNKAKLPARLAAARTAQDAARNLAMLIERQEPVHLSAACEHEAVALPAEAAELLLQVLDGLAAGKPVSVLTLDAALTTQQAADLLGVSRPFVIKEIKAGRLPHRRVGSHRRIAVRDLLAYQRTMDRQRHDALDKLVAEAEALDLGY